MRIIFFLISKFGQQKKIDCYSLKDIFDLYVLRIDWATK